MSPAASTRRLCRSRPSSASAKPEANATTPPAPMAASSATAPMDASRLIPRKTASGAAGRDAMSGYAFSPSTSASRGRTGQTSPP